MSESAAVETRDLRKRYGRDEALKDVDLAVPEGAVVLLAGPNGAGKTTLLRVLMDLVPRDSGDVRVLGMDPRSEGARIRAGAGYLPETIRFPFERLRVGEVLDFHARFRPGWDPAYAAALARELGVERERRWKKLSKGQARRVQIVSALAHRPPLLLLDEPTDGLDPAGRDAARGLLARHLADTGATVVYSTHVLHEVEGLADRLAVLREGRIRVDVSAETLRHTHRRVRLPEAERVEPPPFLLRDEGSAAGERRWIVRADDAEVHAWAAARDVTLIDVAALSLEDAALAHLAGPPDRTARHEHAGPSIPSHDTEPVNHG